LDFAEILRYAADGVIRSDEIWANTGTRFGGAEAWLDFESNSRTAFIEG
jgi:hypothetical protein